jgi:hypothetical protein
MAELRSLMVRRIKTGSVFRIVAAASFSSLIPFCILMGIFGFFGFNTLTWNNQPVHGVMAIIASPFIGVFMAILFAGVFGLLSAFGLWLYSKIRPIKIEVLIEDGGGAA